MSCEFFDALKIFDQHVNKQISKVESFLKESSVDATRSMTCAPDCMEVSLSETVASVEQISDNVSELESRKMPQLLSEINNVQVTNSELIKMKNKFDAVKSTMKNYLQTLAQLNREPSILNQITALDLRLNAVNLPQLPCFSCVDGLDAFNSFAITNSPYPNLVKETSLINPIDAAEQTTKYNERFEDVSAKKSNTAGKCEMHRLPLITIDNNEEVYHSENISEDDTSSPPEPIIKRVPATKLSKPTTGDTRIMQAKFPETSRIEISPGLFVKRPRSNPSADDLATDKTVDPPIMNAAQLNSIQNVQSVAVSENLTTCPPSRLQGTPVHQAAPVVRSSATIDEIINPATMPNIHKILMSMKNSNKIE